MWGRATLIPTTSARRLRTRTGPLIPRRTSAPCRRKSKRMWAAPVDPDHFRSTTQDAYRPVDPSAYKRALPQEEQEDVGPRHVDPDHFRSTTQDAYRPVDPSAYKRALPQEEQEDVGPRHVDPDHFRSTTQDAYRPVDPSAYKRPCRRKRKRMWAAPR
ncbi:putative microtubule-associated protein [Trypanosoma cruzi]|uniref:Putative microtubule-associated protein n=1 Tax=Trypanosoma cruzi TaxID=5693 RepID=A0A2V2X9V9_TRYCR|nr:putative microtubule-associated protein [Trypanosoma cruzi]